MNTITDYMTDKHRECDEFFSQAESAVADKKWVLARELWDKFNHELALHLEAEETILFPQFEQATGMTSGPTQVMRMEHEQMRALINEANNALTTQNKDQFLGVSETLMVLMQQHNMKEEMMLYPMSEQHISDASHVAKALKHHCE